MLKRTLVTLALAAGALVVPQFTPTTTSAAAQQVSVWKASGLKQTTSEYWQPPLTSTTTNTNGRAYIKINVTSKPSNKPVKPAVCFWRDSGSTKNKYETCASTNGVSFTSTGTFYLDLGTPNTWWKKNGVWDWSKQASRGRIMLKTVGPDQLLMNKRCGSYCYQGNDLNNHVPITMSSELIFVAKGAKLACPGDWNTSLCGSGGGGGGATTTSPATTSPATTSPATTSPATTSPATTTPSGNTGLTVQVTPGNRSLTTTWSQSGARLFQFRYKATNTSAWQWDAPKKTTSRTVTGLVNGQTYDVQVRAYFNGKWHAWVSEVGSPNGSGGSGNGQVVPGTATTPRVTVTPGSRSLTTTWSHSGARLFQFRYKATNTSAWQWDAPKKTTSRTVTGLVNGQTYDVQVRAYFNGKWQRWASAVASPGA